MTLILTGTVQEGTGSAMLRAGDTLRIATYNTELSRDGPGLLLRDIRNGRDPQVTAVIEVIRALGPDILVLQNFDFDAGHAAASALQGALDAAAAGLIQPILIGPEGGLSPREVERALADGFTPLTLGPRILRTETAPVVAPTLLQHHFGDL